VTPAAVRLRHQGFSKLNIDEICNDSLDARLNALQAANDCVCEEICAAIDAAQSIRARIGGWGNYQALIG
jgi:hypothetical protein